LSAEPRATPARLLVVAAVALFVLGFVGWLIQGAGDDETVPTLPPTSLVPPTVAGP
jgi:hypothetical protein